MSARGAHFHFPVRARRLALVAALGFGLAGANPALAEPAAIRIGMIPDAGATQVSIEQKAPLRAYLEKALGRPVKLIIPTNYNATVEGLGNGSLDIAYLGGLTFVKAHERYGAVPLVQRETDREFHALFITQADSPIKTLNDLKGKSFAFGDINSTSGHLMPYRAMQKAGIDADKDLKFRYTGSHAATVKAVESGAVDAGACDETVYQRDDAGRQGRSPASCACSTRPRLSSITSGRRAPDLDAPTQEAIIKAFTDLQPGKDDQILAILRGEKFVAADNAEYDAIRATAKQLKLF